MFIYINKHGTLFKQKNNKKHVEIHTVGSACVVGDTLSCDREAGDPFRRDLAIFLGPTLITGPYTYI